MADYGAVPLVTVAVSDVAAYAPLLVGVALGPVPLVSVSVLPVDSYSIGGTAPCPDAPLVGQWWPR